MAMVMVVWILMLGIGFDYFCLMSTSWDMGVCVGFE